VAVRRSPQDKKALSYTKDRRNDYGENDKLVFRAYAAAAAQARA
jgi:hypothetical protein